MSTRKLILPLGVANVKPVWIYGGSSQAEQNHPGAIGQMVLMSNGSIVIRNADTYAQTVPNIYEAFGPGNAGQQTKITNDAVILPLNGTAPTSGNFSLTFGANTTPNQTFNVSAVTLAAALNVLASIIAAGGVAVTGANGGPFTITFNANGPRAAFASGANSLGNTASSNWVGVVNIATTQAGDGGTPNVQTVRPVICGSGAMAMLITNSGIVDNAVFGTLVGPTHFDSRQVSLLSIAAVPQYPILATGIAGPVIGGKPCLFCAGLFAFYYKKTASTASNAVALIDASSGMPVAGFAGGSFAFGTGLTLPAAPRAFSDGAGNFGIHSPGSGSGYNGDVVGTFIWTYTYAFGTAQIPAGLGALVSITAAGVPGFAPPIALYRGTGFNGPIVIAADGSIASQFTVARFSIATPISNGAGKFLHDSILTRAGSDAPISSVAVGMNQALGVVTVTLNGPDATTVYLIGGSLYGYASPAFNGADEVTAVSTLFPDCAVALTSSSAVAGTRTTVITITPPANSTYTLSMTSVGAALGGQSPNFICISNSDGTMNTYYPAPFQQAGTGTGSGINKSQVMSTALAMQGATICHVMRFVPASSITQNFSSNMWGISIPGVGRFNVGLNYARSLSGAGGTATPVNQNDRFQVSAVPFAGGFAIALPHSPFTNSGTPYQYTWNKAAAGATTILLKSPIILIDAAGNPNTAFDTAIYNAFFAFTRTDGARFGPISLVVKNGNLYFGSLYVPGGFLDLTHPARQLSSQGDIINAPTWAPSSAPGANLEVLCACDASGNRVLPANHP